MSDYGFSVKSLDFSNYRKFDSLHIDFSAPDGSADCLNVIVGNNGTGKTTLLDGCAIAISSLLAKMEDSQSLSIRNADARYIVVEKGSVAIRQSQYPVSIKAEGLLDSRPYCWTRTLSSEKSKITRKEARSIIDAGHALQQKVSSGSNVVLPVLAYYDANRFAGKAAGVSLPTDSKSYLASRTKAYSDAFNASIDERQTMTWMRNMTLLELQSGSKSPELACVMRAFSDCYASAADVDEATAYFDLQLQDVAVKYKNRAGDLTIETASSMSDGYRSAALMFADIARRMAQLNPQLGENACSAPGIVLIDEVDLHLHPKWQARIIGDLRRSFPKVQFIVTTHAPIVISSVKAQHLRILTPDGITRGGAETYGGNIARVLKTVMGVDERPARIRDRFEAFYEKIDAGEYEGAKAELDGLIDMIGPDDTEVVAAQTALFLERG